MIKETRERRLRGGASVFLFLATILSSQGLANEPGPKACKLELRGSPPRLFRSEGRLLVRYELVVTACGASAQLEGLEVEEGKGGPTVLEASGDALAALSSVLRSKETYLGGNEGDPIIYVDAPLGAHQSAFLLRNKLKIRAEGSNKMLVLDSRFLGENPVSVGPPLDGGRWVAVHHNAWPRGHRRVLVRSGKDWFLPGRFAIDFVGVDKDGRITSGDPDRTADAVGYGAAVLAVADGVIEKVRDGVEESANIAGGSATPETAAGNYVVLRLPNDGFAVYEHLRPGSISVKAGERVRKGQRLASLGFTGDSTGPHLHFHISDQPDPIGDGLPFSLERFTVLGAYEDLSKLGTTRWTEAAPLVRSNERPAPNVVIDFSQP